MFATIASHRVSNMKTTTRTDLKDIQVVVQSHERTPSLAMTGIDNRTKKHRSKITKRSFAELSHAKDSKLNSRVYEGRLIVNGFHPQLAITNTDYRPSKELLNALPRVTNKKLTLDERISNTVTNCRMNEQTEMRKRQRVSPLDLIPPRQHQQNEQDGTDHELMASDSFLLQSYNDCFKNSNAPQFITDAGGRGVSCNPEFLKICGATLQQPSASFTLFNLIVPSLRFKLFELLSRAVGTNTSQQFPPADENTLHTSAVASMIQPGPSVSTFSRIDEEKKKHLSITLPCIPLPASKISQNITIILMDDDKLGNRCFLSILSPVISIMSQGLNDRPPGSAFGSIGDIQFVSENHLLKLLQGR